MIYQFIPVAAGRVMERLIRSMGPGTMAVLDLEDGYLDVCDPGNDGSEGVRRMDLLPFVHMSVGRLDESKILQHS